MATTATLWRKAEAWRPGWLSARDLRRVLVVELVVALWAMLDHTLDRGLPAGVVVEGVVFGSLYALVAIGIVLVYRANRVVNFAQAEFGSVAAVVAIELILQEHVNYFVAILAGLVMAAVTWSRASLGT